MTKRIILSTSLPMPDDMFHHAERLLKVRELKTDIEGALQKHFPADEKSLGPSPEVALDVFEPPVPKAPKAPAGERKPRQALGNAGDGVRVAEPDALLFRGNEKGAETAEAPAAKKGGKVAKVA